MNTFEGIAFARTEWGFRRYIRQVRKHYLIRERFFRYTDYVSRFSLEETMEIEKIIALDNKFTALLNDEELMMLEYISYHNPGAVEPLNLNHSFYSAFPKWLSVFFNKSEPVFGKIDPVLLGKQIEYLRFCSEIKKSTLASMIGVDRTTIIDIEKGKRIPSF